MKKLASETLSDTVHKVVNDIEQSHTSKEDDKAISDLANKVETDEEKETRVLSSI